MNSKKLDSIDKEISEIRTEMASIGPMRPGSLSRQSRKKADDSYGAYWHLSYTHKGKGHTHYVRDEWAPQIQSEIENYRRFKKLLERSGLKKELRKHEYYEKPCELRRRAELRKQRAIRKGMLPPVT